MIDSKITFNFIYRMKKTIQNIIGVPKPSNKTLPEVRKLTNYPQY
jgi:hypothetical protein